MLLTSLHVAVNGCQHEHRLQAQANVRPDHELVVMVALLLAAENMVAHDAGMRNQSTTLCYFVTTEVNHHGCEVAHHGC